MSELHFLGGLDKLESRLLDICRSMAENERVYINAKEVLKSLALHDWEMSEDDFDHDCEELSSQVEPIEAYPETSIGYAYRLMLQMGYPWRRRYPFFDLKGMYGEPHDELPSDPDYVELRLSRFSNVVMPVGRPPLLPVSLLNGATLPDGTEIPPHNLEELWMAYEQVRQDPNIDLNDLMEVIPGPDFAAGGVVGGGEAIRSLYTDGKGTLTVRGDLQTEIEGGRTRIAVVSLPPGVLIKTVLEQIRRLSAEGLVSFYGINDFSQGEKVRIVLDAPRAFPAPDLKETLFRQTDLERKISFQCSFSDSYGWSGGGSLVSVLKKAAAHCSPAWERKDDEPIEHLPLLREILEFGGYKSPLTDLTDERRSKILNF